MSVIQNLINIILFKDKPEDVPYNPGYTVLAFVLAWFSGNLQASLNPSIGSSLLFVLVQLLTLANFICLFLISANKKERIPQTLLAVFGVTTIFQLIAFLSVTLRLNGFYLLVGIWSIVVMVYIIRHAMEVSKAKAFFLTVGIQISVSLISFLFFPEVFEKVLTSMQEANS